MNLIKKFAFKATFLGLLMSSLTTLPLLAKQNVQAGNHMEGNAQHTITRSEATEAEQYWTPERMKNAQPILSNGSGAPQPVSQPQSPSGSEVSEPGSSSREVSSPKQN